MSRRWLMVSIAVMVVAAPVAASARPRVALAAFAGDSKDHARRVVASVLDHDLAIVGEAETEHALSEREMKRLSKDLDVDAVVHAKLGVAGDNNVLQFSLFVHGKKATGFDIEYTNLKSKKFKRAVHDRLLEKLGETNGEPPEADAKPAGKAAAKHVAQADDGEDPDAGRARHAHKAKKRTAHRDTDAEVDADDADAPGIHATAGTAGAATARGADRFAIRLDVGASATARSLTFSSRQFDQAPPSYKNAAAPGARVAGELYPLAFGDPRQLIAGVGVAGEYDKTIGLGVANPQQFGSTLKVDEHHWSAGGRFRIGFGAGPTPTMTLAVDYGHRAFKVDHAQGALDLPNVEYVGVEPGLDLRVPVTHAFALLAGGRATLLRSAGDIARTAQYGQAKIAGGRATVGIDVVVAPRIALRLAGEAALFKMTFSGSGQQATSRDSDPMTLDVRGARDRYYGGAATLAVFY